MSLIWLTTKPSRAMSRCSSAKQFGGSGMPSGVCSVARRSAAPRLRGGRPAQGWFETANAQPGEGSLHAVDDARALRDQALALAIGPLGILFGNRRYAHHAAMAPFPTQPPQGDSDTTAGRRPAPGTTRKAIARFSCQIASPRLGRSAGLPCSDLHRSGSRLHYRSVRCPATKLRGNWAPDRDLDQRSVGPIPRSRDQATNADHCCRGHRNLLDRHRSGYIHETRTSGDPRDGTVPPPTDRLDGGPDARDGPDPRDAERRWGSSCY